MLSPIPLPQLDAQPLISVIIINYNYEHFLPFTLESLKRQTYESFEAIVCDDGSTDESVEAARKITAEDSRFVVIAKENGGAASALNRGFEESRGEIICLLDSDDIFEPGKLQAIVDAMSATGAGLVIHPMRVIDESGRTSYRIPGLTKFERGWIADDVLGRGGRWQHMPESALSLRREVASLIFPINEEEFRTEQDGYIATLAPLLTTVDYCPQVLGRYRIHTQNWSLAGKPHSLTSSQRGTENLERIARGVNRRLAQLMDEAPRIDAGRHLAVKENLFIIRLLEGESRRKVLGDYVQLAKSTVRDSLLHPLQKVKNLLLFSIFLTAPKSQRPALLSTVFAPSKHKETVRNLVRLISRRRG